MDFLQKIMIEFGPNMAGCITIVFLTYFLLRVRQENELSGSVASRPVPVPAERPATEKVKSVRVVTEEPRFIPPAHISSAKTEHGNREEARAGIRMNRPVPPMTTVTRHQKPEGR